jgi:hypothetical protein
MPDFDNYLGVTSGKIDTVLNFDDAPTVGRRIAQRTTSITIIRAGVEQDAQNVRIEASLGASPQGVGGDNVGATDRTMYVIGYKNHATITDTDIQRGDRFLYDGIMYEVDSLVPNFDDRVVANCKVHE